MCLLLEIIVSELSILNRLLQLLCPDKYLSLIYTLQIFSVKAVGKLMLPSDT